MAKVNKPQSDKDVFSVMKNYCIDKGYTFSDSQLDYLAQSCYLYFESKSWDKIKYWPAVCMRWVLNNLDKQCNAKPKLQGKSVRDTILEQENDK